MAATSTKALLPESAQRMADHLCTLGYGESIMMLPAVGETSAEAAAGLGCSVVEIVKSIIFRRAEDDVPVLVVVSGTNRVDEAEVSAHVGTFAKAGAEFVREKAGYTIGGVCPVSRAVKPVMLLDQDLLQYDSLWTAAGHPHVIFNLAPAELEVMTGAPVTNTVQRG